LIGEYGVITMAVTYSIAIVLPIVGFFFLIFGLMEDSGYLPRLAIMVNRVFKLMGLNGTAVLPMILGLGCDTMATLTARILPGRKERIIVTMLLALAVPCSAQLGVIFGGTATISPVATLIWAGVIIGVIFVVGFSASFVLPGTGSDFIMETPPIRLPKISNIVVKTFARLEWYLKEAVPLFILGTFILFCLQKLGLLGIIENAAAPLVVNLLGLPKEVAGALIMGFLRRDYAAVLIIKEGNLDPIQMLVALVTITLFVPCIANFFIMIKERGLKTALLIVTFIFAFAFLFGGLFNFVLRYLEVGF
jgi:ferrous iron transport protein B